MLTHYCECVCVCTTNSSSSSSTRSNNHSNLNFNWKFQWKLCIPTKSIYITWFHFAVFFLHIKYGSRQQNEKKVSHSKVSFDVMNSFEMSIDFLNSMLGHLKLWVLFLFWNTQREPISNEMGFPKIWIIWNEKIVVFLEIGVLEETPQEFSLDYIWKEETSLDQLKAIEYFSVERLHTHIFYCFIFFNIHTIRNNDRITFLYRRPLLVLIIVISHHAWYPQLFVNIIIFSFIVILHTQTIEPLFCVIFSFVSLSLHPLSF